MMSQIKVSTMECLMRHILVKGLKIISFLIILTLSACGPGTLDGPCSLDPDFHGCFERVDAPIGNITINQEGCNLLGGTGSGLFDDQDFNDTETVLLIQGNRDITDVAAGGSAPLKMVTPNGNARFQNASWKFGGGSISFDGSGDYLSIGDHGDFNFSDGTWTVDTWARVNAIGGEYMLYYQQTDASNYMYIKIQVDNTVRFGVVSDGAHIVILTTPDVILDTTTWYHIEVVENGNNYYIFIDGIQQASISDTSRPANYTGPVYIGADSGGSQSLNGYLDEIRVSRITRHTANFTPRTMEWQELEWSFTGTVTELGRATLHITPEEDPERIFDVEAWNPGAPSNPDRGRLRIQRPGYPLDELQSTPCP